MKIATAGSRNSKRWRTQDITWSELLERLRTPLRTGEAFADYRRMSREERDAKKNAAGGFVGGAMNGGRRVAGAVYERWLITLDADEAKAEDWAGAECLWDNALACYSTHSHAPEAPRLRWVIPLRRAVSREEYEPLARMAAQMLGILETLDASTYQPERLMYWPTAAQDGEYIFRTLDGPFLDPDALLRLYGPGEAWKDVSLWPMASREREIVRREIRRQADPTSKPGLVGVFCRTYDIHEAIAAFLPQVYTEAGEDRYTYAAGSTSGGAVVYGEGLWLYSNHATDPAWGQLCNAFDLVRIHRFGAQDQGRDPSTETTQLPSYKAMSQWVAELPEIRRAMGQEALERAQSDFADLGMQGHREDGEAAPAAREGGTEGLAAPDTEPDESWMEALTRNSRTGAVDPSVDNLLLILENDPLLRGAMAYNEFSARPVRRGPLPWRPGETVADGRNGDPWEDSDDAGLRWYLEKYWRLEGRQKVQDAWSMVISRHAFHPVRDYLAGLVWDGADRLDTMLVRWMGAEDTPYVRAATRKWMTAAVARVMEPGCKFDQLLVLVGAQGIGKSTLAYTLSQGWFSDSLNGMSGKEAFEALRGVWIVELAELAATRRSEEETIKNYITKRVDTYRPAYGRQVVDYPRQCVFYGTTNDPNIIKDRTGGRRYWPVEVTGFDRGQLRGLEQEVDQLWAEAVARYRAGETRWMSEEGLYQAAQEAQAAYTLEDELTGIICEYLDKPLPGGWDDLPVEERVAYIQGRSALELGPCTARREAVSILEIRMELLGEDRQTIGRNDSTSRRIAGILNNLPGWRRTGKPRRRGVYGPQKVYERAPDELD